MASETNPVASLHLTTTVKAGLACAALVIIGSFGAWASLSVGGESESWSGTAAGGDGRWTAMLGVAAAVLLLAGSRVEVTEANRRIMAWAAAGCFTIAGIIGIVNLSDLERVAGAVESTFAFFEVESSLDPDWGLVLVLLGSVAGAVVSYLVAQRSSSVSSLAAPQ